MNKNPRFHKLKVKDIRRETNDAVSIALDIPIELVPAYQYEPGQHLTFRTTINDEEVRRSYSVCTGLYENELRVAVKKQPFGKFSTFANDVLKVGDEIDVMTPLGLFTTEIKEDTEKSFLFFAGGSGITPVISLIKTILHTAKKSDVTLVYGNRGFNHIIFREQFEDLKNENMDRFSLVHVFSDEKIGNELLEGILNKEKILIFGDTIFKDQKFDEVFVCGPKPMIFAVKEIFEESGYSTNQIHFELFTSPEDDKKKEVKPRISDEKGEGTDVTVIIDGEEIYFKLRQDGMSVLDAANQAAADAPYSCKGGVCSTCKARVIEGEVVMDANYALEEDELNAGYVLTCQSHPTTKKLVISYDE